MLVSIQQWLCVLLALLTTVYGLYLPSSHRYPRGPVHVERRPVHTAKRSDRAFYTFSRIMSHQQAQYREDQAFVDRMFRLFDMNANQVIERDEFRTILQLLGIVSNTF